VVPRPACAGGAAGNHDLSGVGEDVFDRQVEQPSETEFDRQARVELLTYDREIAAAATSAGIRVIAPA